MTRAITLAAAAMATLAFAAPAGAASRLLFSSDWSGTSQIYAADPSGSRPTAQITFGRAPACGEAECGYGDTNASPDGKYVLYSDWGSCDGNSHPPSLYVARADGSHPRRLARAPSTFVCRASIAGKWAPDSRRVAYTVDHKLHVARVDRRSDRMVAPSAETFAWSPDGNSLAYTTEYTTRNGSLWILRGGRKRMIALEAANFAWSPNGRWIAYDFPTAFPASPELDIVRPDGTRRQTLLTGYFLSLKWSADSRFLATSIGGLMIFDVVKGSHVEEPGLNDPLAWQPRSHRLAVTGNAGTYVFNVDSGKATLLTPDHPYQAVWSPDGRSLAYVGGQFLGTYAQGGLEVVDLAGTTRTVVPSTGPYGGMISDLVWTRSPKGTTYRKPQPRALANIRVDGLTALWPIVRLASDGERVAYVSCGHVFIWTPSTRAVVQTEPDTALSPRCTMGDDYYAFWIYTLALDGNRISYGDLSGNMGQTWDLYSGGIKDPASFVLLGGVGGANGCAIGNGGLGELAGAGDLLVFSTWRDNFTCPPTTLEQQIHRVGTNGCPCPVIATSHGPLVPFDVDSGRIVAGGDNATVIFDAQGKQLLSVPVSPLAAQLSDSDLVVLVQGRLLVYDAITGGRLHTWPLPDVPSGAECGSPHYGTWRCGQPRLVLEDAAHGLAAYVLDRHVHVMRLSDGSDATVATGTLARFTRAGLLCADDRDLHLFAFDELPLR